MCQFIEIEFSCSDGGPRHSTRTTAVIGKCGDPTNCIVRKTMSGTEAEFDIKNVDDAYFRIVHVGGYCEKCRLTNDKNMPIREDVLANFAKVHLELGIESAAAQEEEISAVMDYLFNDMSSRNVTRRRAVYDPKGICSSGTCTKPVIVIKNRRGCFCQEHTCAARDWGCLLDATPKRDGSPHAMYCSAHTCDVHDCRERVADKTTVHCKKHS